MGNDEDELFMTRVRVAVLFAICARVEVLLCDYSAWVDMLFMTCF